MRIKWIGYWVFICLETVKTRAIIQTYIIHTRYTKKSIAFLLTNCRYVFILPSSLQLNSFSIICLLLVAAKSLNILKSMFNFSNWIERLSVCRFPKHILRRETWYVYRIACEEHNSERVLYMHIFELQTGERQEDKQHKNCVYFIYIQSEVVHKSSVWRLESSCNWKRSCVKNACILYHSVHELQVNRQLNVNMKCF